MRTRGGIDMARENNEVVMEPKVRSEVIEQAATRFVKLPAECKSFILGYMIGIQQSRREKRSA